MNLKKFILEIAHAVIEDFEDFDFDVLTDEKSWFRRKQLKFLLYGQSRELFWVGWSAK